MNQKKKALVLFFVMVILIYLIDHFTTKRYNTVSGNGNPALPFVLILIPLIFWFSYYVIQWMKKSTLHWSIELFLVIATLFINIWVVNRQYQKLQYIKDQLQSSQIDPELVGELTSGLTYYTNTVYFNYFTLFMILSFVCVTGIILKRAN